MSSKPQLQAGPRPDDGADAPDSARTVPGTDADSLAATADEEDERETLRAPPRLDQTPVFVPTLGADAFRTEAGRVPAPLGHRPGPPPLPARLPDAPDASAAAVTTPAGPPRLRAARPPLPGARAAAPEGTTLDGDTVRASTDVRDDEDTRRIPIEGRFVGVSEIKIPPLPMPKDMVKLLELENVSGAQTVPPANELRPPAYGSTLSPAERAARKQEPRRGRLLAGLAIAAAGVVAIGVSSMWQPVATPIVPKRGAVAARVEKAATSAPTATQTPEAAPTPAMPEAPAVTAVVEPKPQAQPAQVATPRTPGVGMRKRAPLAPAVDPSTLPESPTRQTVIDAMTPLREEIARCSEGRGGVAEIMLTVASSGAVLHAAIVGDYAGTAQGSCIALAARKARFAPFQQERFSVRYPVAL